MGPVVATPAGAVRGRVGDDGITRFLGIPYARAGRFEPPGSALGWTGERDATAPGPQAPQRPGMLDQVIGTAAWPMHEDCLVLNVHTPACDGARRPVVVWIHGGAFTNGCGSAPWFDGAAFARNGDVVVVGVHYRLGLLGFFHLADLGGERFAGTGNLGLLDQIAALRWVRETIAGFGGDPDNVTVFGESAGGASVLALLAAPAADGLIHRAVAQSPSFGQLRSRDRGDQTARLALDRLGVGVDELHRLHDLPLDALLDTTVALWTGAGFDAFGTTVDDHVLTDHPTASLAGGRGGHVPLLVGANRDEMHLFFMLQADLASMDRAGLLRRAGELLGAAAPTVVERYEAARPGASPVQLASWIAGDHTFRLPGLRLADARHALGHASWVYLLTWPTPAFGGIFGACHGLDLPFVFHNLDQPGVSLFTGDGPERAHLADDMHGAWIRFARTGDPGWSPYDPVRRPTMVFDAPSYEHDDPDGAVRRAWEGVA
jgi:para-nitrobenzyl esterase